MFSMLYFPLVSGLATPAPASQPELHQRLLDALLGGKLDSASRQMSRVADESDGADHASYSLQLHADLQLALGIEVEAEDCYRRAQKLIRSSKHAIRAASCRSAAWQAFFRYRLGTALVCFSRIVDEPEIATARAVEARIGIVCVLHELGRTSAATEALDELATRINQDLNDQHGHWRDVLTTLRFDLAVQNELRCASALSDHVYWQSGHSSDRAPHMPQSGALSVDGMFKAAQGVRAPLLRARIDYLQQMRLAASGERDAAGALNEHLLWARDQGLGEYARTLRLEITLSMLVAASPNLAQNVLEPLHHVGHAGTTGRRQLEYLYCAAKMRLAQGRQQESMQLYSRYALVAMQCLREDSQVRVPVLDRAPRASLQLDDVGARLSGRYRRAYYYVLENLERRDLSVREIAAEVGVTERALQNAFKNFLGLSPTELIRRLRMEGIRAELAQGAYAIDRGVLHAASKWGVQNRSTLLNSYRKQFHEAPSETLDR